jgi:Uncharacterized archaeal kinase related to aspartokinases, uridylate kinases
MMTVPQVVKIGGSLFDRAGELAALFRELDQPLLIVPGGGTFADAIRRCGISGEPAHWMAVAAMEQFGWYISSFGIPVQQEMDVPDGPVIFLPYTCLRIHDPLPHSWDVTSDTIAAWVADVMHYELIILKSVDGIYSGGVLRETVMEPVTSGDVDPCLIPYVLRHAVPTRIINGRHLQRVRLALTGHDVTGTTISL